MHAIETKGLSKRYGHRALPIRPPFLPPPILGVRALDDVDVSIDEGEVFGFLGPNGAGKTTMIRLLLGFIHPSGGEATVLGLDSQRDSVEIRRRTGYLPGGIALYDSLSGERLLNYLGQLTDRPSVRRAELLERLELSARTLDRPVRDYSRGMRQKMGIIQALQHDPELAILDEPTEGLDPLMQRAFYAILDDLKRAGRTVFFSPHILSEVERVCDRVAIIRQGRIVALERVADLLAHRKRYVEMRLAGPAPNLDGVAGVSGLLIRDEWLSCQLVGDVRPFLAAIAGAPIADLSIEPAHLEEAFLEYYADAELDADRGPRPPAGTAPPQAAR